MIFVVSLTSMANLDPGLTVLQIPELEFVYGWALKNLLYLQRPLFNLTVSLCLYSFESRFYSTFHIEGKFYILLCTQVASSTSEGVSTAVDTEITNMYDVCVQCRSK